MYKANQRPLIDVVRDDLQDLLEKAAEMDCSRVTIDDDLDPTRQRRSRHANTTNTAIQIEMGTFSSSTCDPPIDL